MEQQSSTSTVTVEFFDPHDVYKLLAPGLVPRLPLHNLHWQSHSGPLRSIDTLHVELVSEADGHSSAVAAAAAAFVQPSDHGSQTQHVGGSSEAAESTTSLSSKLPGNQRRHQIPGIRPTPYLKLLLVRCDDNDSYKSSVRAEIREWIKTHTQPAGGSKKTTSGQENHDAFEWLIVHVVIPNTVASTQPRTNHKSDGTAPDKTATSRWRTGSTPLMEKLRTDFNGSTKGSQDRIAQIRIGINDVPYNLLPRVVPAVPTGYTENDQDAENAWSELIGKFKSLILSSFDMRVTQYEEDIREKDSQRSLPGWNFCTFFMLKEGLARGFENVGLVEDALVGYDELNIGLDAVIHEQLESGSPEAHGGAMLSYTKELKVIAETALAEAAHDDATAAAASSEDTEKAIKEMQLNEIPISSTKKAYRDMIMENKVSVFDFRCYIFSRQIALLLRLGNAVSSREELLTKLRRQQQSILTGEAPLAPPPSHKDEPENLVVFAEICERTLQFIPAVSQILRRDIVSALVGSKPTRLTPEMEDTVENMMASFAFSVAQQILAQTLTKALPIPPSNLSSIGDGQEPKALIPEPKTMLHPARNTSLFTRGSAPRPPPLSPGVFPGPGRQMLQSEAQSQFVKPGLEDLAARRAELYMLSRTVLTSLGKKRGWSNGWDEAPVIGEDDADIGELEDVNLDDDEKDDVKERTDHEESEKEPKAEHSPSINGIDSQILRAATNSEDGFYRLYEILTDKAMRHFTVAGHDHAVHSSIADLAVLKFHVKEFKTAAYYFGLTAPFFGDSGWNTLELAMLTMYARSLDEMQSKVDYVSVALKLLTKSCAAQRERLMGKRGHARRGQGGEPPDAVPLKGIVGKLCELAKTLSSELKAPLANFFTNVELAGPPEYPANQDGCSLYVCIHSLLPERIGLESIKLRIVSVDGGPGKERTFETTGDAVHLDPGKNRVKLDCNSVVAGRYKIDFLGLSSSNFLLHFGRDASTPTPRMSDIFKHSEVVLFQRTSTLDITLAASKHTSLDKNNSLELMIFTGWNTIKSCEVRVKPATGGLRFATQQATIVDSTMEFAKPSEAGVFYFGAIDTDTRVVIQFPYSMEQDVTDVFAKIEATYVTEAGGNFSVAKSLTVPVSLALGVNVQDVFKHRSLFSRFNVSTATSSPLRLYKSELLGCELFESAFGVAPSTTITILPKQPASLLFRVRRKAGVKNAGGSSSNNNNNNNISRAASARTMHLKLHYSLLETEVEERIKQSLHEALEGTPLKEYGKLVAASVLGEARNRIQPRDLERAALTGEVTTSHLREVTWENHFDGLGTVSGSGSGSGLEGTAASAALCGFLQQWLKQNPRIAIPPDSSSSSISSISSIIEPCSILIPVEVPSVSVVHTADIRLRGVTNGAGAITSGDEGTPVVWTNQMLPAMLHLQWTRIWRTMTMTTTMTAMTEMKDQEFSYEVSAPADTWLIGGRRKGHFTIPASSSEGDEKEEQEQGSSSEMALVLIPLREGWLPYPTVEIREIIADAAGQSQTQTQSHGQSQSQSQSQTQSQTQSQGGCEIDLRNLGETVRVVGNRSSVTVSLDASGPGGGPLAFESEGVIGLSRIVA